MSGQGGGYAKPHLSEQWHAEHVAGAEMTEPADGLATSKRFIARAEELAAQIVSLREIRESAMRKALAAMPVGTTLRWIVTENVTFTLAPDGWRSRYSQCPVGLDWIELGLRHGDLALEVAS